MNQLPESDALARVRAELAALGTPPMPSDVAARIGAALADAQHAPGPAPDEHIDRHAGEGSAAAPGPVARCAPARPVVRTVRPSGRPRAGSGRSGRRRAALPAGLVAGSVAAVAAVVLTVLLPGRPSPASEESDLQAAGAGAVGTREAGPLTDPALRRACLSAIGVPEPDATLLGGRPYAVDGRPGTLLVLGTGTLGRFRLLVVDPGCGPAGGQLMAGTTVGR